MISKKGLIHLPEGEKIIPPPTGGYVSKDALYILSNDQFVPLKTKKGAPIFIDLTSHELSDKEIEEMAKKIKEAFKREISKSEKYDYRS